MLIQAAKNASESRLPEQRLPTHKQHHGTIIQAAIIVFESRVTEERLHYAEIARLAISHGLISGEHSAVAKTMLRILKEATRLAVRYSVRRNRVERRYMFLDHGSGVFSFSPATQVDNASTPTSSVESRSKKLAASNARKTRKRPKPWNDGMLPSLRYADVARQVLTRCANQKPMHYCVIAEKAVELNLVSGPVEDTASKMCAQLLEEAHWPGCQFTYHSGGLIGLKRWSPRP